ncbi:MAG TPA: fumarylacetoacetate hydrolase family protein [Acidobacteriaceae bacterium]|nr:fumarylacetoacetate hydrolase family protein [Acidobacteriaceae bacterium]
MKLLNFYNAEGARAMGLVEDNLVYDLSKASNGDPDFSTVGKWLASGDATGERIKSLRDQVAADPSTAMALSTLKHAPLVERDAQIFCVGLNYADHAAENNVPPPTSPIFFTKLPQVVVTHGAEVPIPAITDMVDYEAEVAVVIGRRADRVSEAEANECIAGYSIMNDVSARDLQRLDKQWFRGKNCNGFGPLGPWLVTADDIVDATDMEVTLRVNGEERQHSNTKNLVFGPAALISILSQTLVLEPGDVISTGTPAGIGSCRKPPVYLRAGDRVEIEVAGIGILENTMVAEKPKTY